MLVKHNVSTFYDMSKEGVNVWSRGESNHSIVSDVYLPYKNNLPEDKQPLLPPEGNYKEIQAR